MGDSDSGDLDDGMESAIVALQAAMRGHLARKDGLEEGRGDRGGKESTRSSSRSRGRRNDDDDEDDKENSRRHANRQDDIDFPGKHRKSSRAHPQPPNRDSPAYGSSGGARRRQYG